MSDEWNGPLLARKMAAFCWRRLSPLVQTVDVQNLQSYLSGLVANRSYPAAKRRDFDWKAIAERSEVSVLHIAELRKEMRRAREAIVRALNASAALETPPPKDAKANRGLTVDIGKRHTRGLVGIRQNPKATERLFAKYRFC